MATIKKEKIKSVGEDVGKTGTLVHYWWEWETEPSLWGTSMEIPQTIKKRTII